MNPETLERLLEAIEVAKREMIAIDPHQSVKAELDHAYRSLSEAGAALRRLVGVAETS